MSMRYPGGFITASYNGLKVPDAPTIGTATAGQASASVAFTAPTNIGGGAITGYTVISSPGSVTGTGASSPITVSGLTVGQAYTFTVVAVNSYGPSAASAASNSVTPTPIQGQAAYTTVGTYTWVAPSGVTSVSTVAVGAGGRGSYTVGQQGGGGGELRYRNNMTVTPGNSYTVVVGALAANSTTAGFSQFTADSSVLVKAFGGSGGAIGGAGGSGGTGTGGGNGGSGGTTDGNSSGTGGGAGGYSGNGGDGSNVYSTGITNYAGSGGGGGGGYSNPSSINAYTGGGGVGLLGQGTSGSASTANGGSGGANGTCSPGQGGNYGGGSSGNGTQNNGVGAVRIIWPGTTRSFPSTNTGDL